MKKIYILVISIGIILVVVGLGYLRGSSASQPIQSYLCKSRGCNGVCNGSTQCIIQYWDGKKEYYCCPHCAFPERIWKLGHGDQIRKVTVVDFGTGKTINAVGAYYLVDSNLHLCCSPSIVAFRTKLQAERFQQNYGGVITRPR
ncbi:MAG: nitrous oxide reductase accessory protein NosL [bacterium]|nr:nitrous oxide reductase accessory protein NosL [bacterium]